MSAQERARERTPVISRQRRLALVRKRRRGQRRDLRRLPGDHGPARAQRRRQDDAAPHDDRPRRRLATARSPSSASRCAHHPPLYRRMGVMSEHETVYGFMNGPRFVSYDATAAQGRRAGPQRQRGHRAGRPRRRAASRHGTYSRGMRQRMRLAATLVHEPEVLILDEPLNGADPRQRVHFKQLLLQLAAEGRTIVLSSHILEEVEQLADTRAAHRERQARRRGRLPRHPRRAQPASVPRARHLRRAANARRRSDRARLGGRRARRRRRAHRPEPQRRRSAGRAPSPGVQLDVRLTGVEPLDDSLESVFGYLVETLA